MLGGAGQNSFFTNTDLVNGYQSGTVAIVSSAYPKNSNTIINNIYFFDPTSQYELYNVLYLYELINKRNTNESTDLGLICVEMIYADLYYLLHPHQLL